MFTLLYKTRGGAEPTGKQRVFFSCHPDDFDRYFDEISNDILASQNCATYYIGKEAEAEYDENLFLSYLAEMRLVVIPVTTNLLTRPSRALDVVYKFTQERHIPVLTLMQEDGLDELYTRAFGDLQYLDKYAKDNTAIPFEKKLADYLASVLIGDELAEKVRKSFDAYIFLSYRKKDRVHAQELMKLIHKNDFCRDIAIWYDEFLTPGEGFNGAIKAAFEKSSLFTLAVTPNLLEDGNYVMKEEYPMARESGKKILPAEVVGTDRKELEKKYKGIPDCTDAHDAPQLSASLLAALEGIAKRENDSDQVHNFMIGLAYLTGIDVEVDVDRALNLITGAAKAGVVEAIEKLVAMYRSGDGVERDYLRAIEWQEKLVALWEARYNESGSDHDGYSYSSELGGLSDYWRELGRLSEAKACLEKVLNIDETIASGTDELHMRDSVAGDYDLLGDITAAEGRLADACKYYEKSFEIRQKRAEEMKTAALRLDLSMSRKDLSESYIHLGDIAKAEGRLADAREHYEKSLEIVEALAEEAKSAKSRRDLLFKYSRLERIARAEGQTSEVREYYLKAMEIRIALLNTVDARRELSTSYERLGNIAQAEGRLTDAREYYEKSFDISVMLAEEEDTAESRRDLSVSYDRLGGIAEAEGRLADARGYYDKLLDISVALAEERQTVDSRRNLAVSYSRLGGIAEAEGRLGDAREYYEKSLEIKLRLAEETKTVGSRRDLSVSYNNLGRIAKAEKRLADARKYYEKAFEIDIALVEETKAIQSYDDLAVAYYNLGIVDRLNINRDYLFRTLEIWEELVRACPGVNEFKRRRDMVKKLLGG